MITAARRFALITALTVGAVTASTVLAPAATTHAGHPRVAATPSSTLPSDDILDGLLGTVGDVLKEVVGAVTDLVGDIGLGDGSDLLGGA